MGNSIPAKDITLYDLETQSPFHLKTETSIYMSNSDEDMTIEGRIDVLVLKENFWILVIESKRAELSFIKSGVGTNSSLYVS